MTESTAARLIQWSEKLRSASGGSLLARPAGTDLSPPAATLATIAELLGSPAEVVGGSSAALQAELWRAAASDSFAVPGALMGGEGWLVPQLREEGIETWQEAELMCLHALAWVGLRQAAVLDRVLSAARVCIAEVQPDNVTGRPWAAHVFAWMAVEQGDLDASMYAETLVHNVLVARRQPEPTSTVLMLDSAAWLRAMSRR